jgi:hypothetical protein
MGIGVRDHPRSIRDFALTYVPGGDGNPPLESSITGFGFVENENV